MEALADAQRFDALLIAAQGYLASGAGAAQLSLSSVAKLKLLPISWLTSPSRGSDYRLYLRTDSDGLITAGLLGTREALRPLVDRYCIYARRIKLTADKHARKTVSALPEGTYYYPLMMSFDRLGLARAAELALSEPPQLDVGYNSARRIQSSH
jgi:hypothetical protein